MKCNSCGAEIGSNKVCQYCGSQITYSMKREVILLQIIMYIYRNK